MNETIFQKQRQSQSQGSDDDTPDVEEEVEELEQPKPPRPKLYKGQIWANADGSIARKVVQVRRNTVTPWKVVWVTVADDGTVSTETVSIIDEFLFWAMRNEAMPMMDRYQ